MKKFALKFKKEEVEIENESGIVENYTVNEVDGDIQGEYLEEQRDLVIMERGEVVGMKTFKGTYPRLLKYTLRDSKGELVKPDIIGKWPASVQKGLFDIAQKLNGLSADAQEAAKNV